MAIKSIDQLCLHSSLPEAHNINNDIPWRFIVGIYKSTFLSKIDEYDNYSCINKILTKKPKLVQIITEDVKFLAMVQIEIHRELLIVKNVAAIDKFGPTMYAISMQLAKSHGYLGIATSKDPKKIKDKSKEIWRQFSQRVDKGINLTKIEEYNHKEDWLNHYYSLVPEFDLISLCRMQKRNDRYMSMIDYNSNFENPILEDMARDLGRKSVEVYQ